MVNSALLHYVQTIPLSPRSGFPRHVFFGPGDVFPGLPGSISWDEESNRTSIPDPLLEIDLDFLPVEHASR